VAVAIIHKQQIQLPRGSSRLEGGDQLLIAASETASAEAFKKDAAAKRGPNSCILP
jgi:Trk K+ transport system NAD-binding subunit